MKKSKILLMTLGVTCLFSSFVLAQTTVVGDGDYAMEQTQVAAAEDYAVEEAAVYEEYPPTTGQKIAAPFVAAGKYTWKGIKAVGIWTWIGIKKGAYYTKEGTISFCEKTGMKTDPETNAVYEKVIEDANGVLIESRTRREIRHQEKVYSE